MFSHRGPATSRVALAACAVAGLLALVGCSSGGSSSSSGASTPASSSATASTSPAASTPASGQPSWAASLGAGVTVTAPQAFSPGTDSPGAAVQGELSAFASKKPTTLCDYQQPSFQAQCKAGISQVPADHLPFASNTAIGWVAIQGTKALVGTTGKYCTPGQTPECFTNSDPAALFTSAKTFSQLWSDAVKSPVNAYSLAPCVQVGGKWYIYSTS